MNPLYRAVTSLQARLTGAGIPSVVIGGIAVSVWAQPRATVDVDLKVLLDRNSAERLLDVLGGDYQPIQRQPLEALRRNGVLFVKDPSGIRVDIQLADVSLDESAIGRGVLVELEPGLSATVCSPEDLVIYKMISTRPRDRQDVENVVRRQGDKLDDAYVARWLRLLEQALDESDLVSAYEQLRGRTR